MVGGLKPVLRDGTKEAETSQGVQTQGVPSKVSVLAGTASQWHLRVAVGLSK